MSRFAAHRPAKAPKAGHAIIVAAGFGIIVAIVVIALGGNL